jgi:APA family basic amino acid/polyamine antiporter
MTLGLWMACGGLVLAGAFTFGELASRYPQAGGLYVYLREAWGARVAFLYGWQSLLVLDPGVTAALASGFSQYLLVLWPAVHGMERWVAVATIWALALLNMTGLRLSARVMNVLTFFKLAALAAIVLVAFTIGKGSWSHLVPFAARRAGGPPFFEALALGLVGVFFSFGGFWEASRVTGEVRSPRRTMPVALAIGVTAVTVAYVGTTVAFMYLVPAEQATGAAEFARRAGEAMLGAPGPTILAAIVVLSIAASAMALLIMAPRLYVAMSADGLFPSAMGSLNPVTKAPARATALLAFLASVFTLAGTFQQIVAFFLCSALGFIALAAAALFVVRRREPDETVFLAPGHPFSTALFMILVLIVVIIVGMNRPLQALAGFAVVLAGLPAYDVFASRGEVTTHASNGVER